MYIHCYFSVLSSKCIKHITSRLSAILCPGVWDGGWVGEVCVVFIFLVYTHLHTRRCYRAACVLFMDCLIFSAVLLSNYLYNHLCSRIYLVTWNVHGSSPPSNLADLLSLNEPQLPDVYAIG